MGFFGVIFMGIFDLHRDFLDVQLDFGCDHDRRCLGRLAGDLSRNALIMAVFFSVSDLDCDI